LKITALTHKNAYFRILSHTFPGRTERYR
jgi:hypothetical protein